MYRKTNLAAAALLLFSALAWQESRAVPISQQYEFAILINGLDDEWCGSVGCNAPAANAFVGQTYTGYFSLATDALAVDGIVNTRPLSFSFEIGDVIFDSSRQGCGMADPFTADGKYLGFCDYSFNGWGIQVQDHQLAGFSRLNNVHSETDAWWVDLFPVFGSDTDVARISSFVGDLRTGSQQTFQAVGNYSIRAIPEPALSSMLLGALAAGAAFGFRRMLARATLG